MLFLKRASINVNITWIYLNIRLKSYWMIGWDDLYVHQTLRFYDLWLNNFYLFLYNWNISPTVLNSSSLIIEISRPRTHMQIRINKLKGFILLMLMSGVVGTSGTRIRGLQTNWKNRWETQEKFVDMDQVVMDYLLFICSLT